MKIYISGPISGESDYLERFAAVEKMLTEQGNVVINPARVLDGMPGDTPYETYMTMAMAMLKDADAIYLMKGWTESRGARQEYGYALGANLMILGGWKR